MFTGEFDSGTTCLLLPNSDVKGNFTTSPFGILAREQVLRRVHADVCCWRMLTYADVC